MTNEEALNICNQAIKYIAIKYSDYDEENVSEITRQICEQMQNTTDIQIITDAIEKQIPERVNISRHNIAFCPICDGSVWQNADESNYCFRCGQKLRW